MDFSPIEIKHQEFPKQLRGYSVRDVREYLDRVADAMQRVAEDKGHVLRQMETLNEQLAKYHNLEETLQKTLVLAQKTAEEIILNAKKESDLIIEKARMDEVRFRDEFAHLKATKEDFETEFQALLETFMKRLSHGDRDE